MQIMDEAGFEYARPEGAFYLFVKVPDNWNDDDMAYVNHLKKYNILCAPGSGFGGKGWFRIAYCVSEQTILNSKNAWIKARKES
jgi:aspartate aminotransferase